jgi:small subunit ribosomal protein S20
VETKDSAKASETLKTMYSALDRAAKVGVIHKRAADRRKSRYSAQVKAIAA